VNQESSSNLHIEPTQIDDILNQQSNEQPEISSCSNISIKAFKNLVTEDGIMLISKWYNEAVVPRNKVQILINDLNGFNDNCMQILKKEVLDNLKKNNSDENSISKISVMFDVINDPFQNLKTEYKRLKVLEELGVYVKPIEIAIGSRNKNITKNDNIVISLVNVNICFILLRCIFKVFFEQPNVLKTVLEYFKRLNSMTGGIVCSFVQSEVWKVKCQSSPDKIIIPFFLYFDEYETNNPLGAHAGKKKLGAVYVSFGSCLPSEFQSSLNYIFLALLFIANDRKEFGNKNIFKELINEINYLQKDGIIVNVESQNYTIYFSLALIIGDNLGLHSMLGFSESFNANYPCRFCLCSKIECNYLVSQDDSKMRNTENYSQGIAIDNLSLTGINELCVWNQIDGFHAVHNHSVDLMHDILEGVCSYDLCGILYEFIINLKYFSLDTLNNRLQYFNYGPLEVQNKPQSITMDTIRNKKKLKMSAIEVLCFSRHLGVLIGDLVPINSEFWQLYILLRQIIQIVTLKSIQPEHNLLLKTLITEHHELYLKLFSTNLKPKYHHLLHYPLIMSKVGPVSHLWSMRYESKHRESKLTAHSITSRKNICYTLSVKHQLRLAHRLLSKSNTLSLSLESSNVGKVIDMSINEIEKIQNNLLNQITNLNSVSFVSWVQVKGTRYTTKQRMIIIIDVKDMPIFVIIKYIFFKLQCDIPFLIGQRISTIGFNEHLQAYEIKNCNDLLCISFDDLLVEQSPCVCSTMSDGCTYVSCNF